MQISASDIGKRFNREWIFRNFSAEFIPGGSYAITGPNGSGKSTLLQILAGAITPSEGHINYGAHHTDNIYKQISIAAPYQELIEEMTLTEFLHFHSRFKPLSLQATDIISVLGLTSSAGKQIRNFSSGMKQRVKLAQAIFSATPCVFLDEPCTNLDAEGIGVYQRLISEYCTNRLLIVSSNDIQEYGFCRQIIDILPFKPRPAN